MPSRPGGWSVSVKTGLSVAHARVDPRIEPTACRVENESSSVKTSERFESG